MWHTLLPLAQRNPFAEFEGRSRGSDIGWDMLRIIAVDVPKVVIFGALGIALLVIAFKVFDKMNPKLDFEVELAEKRNYPLAIVIAAFFVAVAWVIVSVMRP